MFFPTAMTAAQKAVLFDRAIYALGGLLVGASLAAIYMARTEPNSTNPSQIKDEDIKQKIKTGMEWVFETAESIPAKSKNTWV